MKLIYWTESPNFGDELNPWLWPRLLPPGTFDDNSSTLFYGLGTMINHRLLQADRLIFFGSGVGYTNDIEVKIQPNWKIYCVRGPLSAAALHLPESFAICDPAILMARFFQRSAVRHEFAYMPHHSHMNETLASVCQKLNLHLIDPTKSVEAVMAELCATGTLVTEALHGAIVGDALGIPWVPVCSEGVLQFKWQDYTKSLGLDYAPLPVAEVWYPPQEGVMGFARNAAKRRQVAMQIKRALGAKPLLSDRAVLESRMRGLEARLEDFKRDIQTLRLTAEHQ